MKRKVKITKAPKFAHGGMHLGDQQNYGLYRGGGYLQDYVTGTEVPSDKDIRSTYPEVDREEASIEVEKGEKILLPDFSGLYNVGGKPHSKGGTPVKAQGGEYVFSNYITMPEPLQEVFGFKGKSSKKKDNTIAALLGNKVDSKEYNRLSQILQDANDGKPVDQFELKHAQIRFPEYMELMQKAMVGGELSKAIQGKDFKIPENAMPALEKLMQQAPIKNEMEDQPLTEAKEGGYMNKKLRITGTGLEKYQQKPGQVPGSKKYSLPNIGDVNAEYVEAVPEGFVQYPNLTDLYWKQGQSKTTGGAGANAQPVRGRTAPYENWLPDLARKGVDWETITRYVPGVGRILKDDPTAKKLWERYYVPKNPVTTKEADKFVYTQQAIPEKTTNVETPKSDDVTIPYQPKLSTTPSFNSYRGASGKPWWTEDVMRTALAFSQYPTAQYPTLQQVNLPQTDPIVVEPYYAPITGQAASARNVAAATSSPQMLRNFLSGTQPIDAVNNITYQTAVANADRVQRAREQNAQIAGQEALMNANLRGKYIADVDRVTGELEKEKEMYNANKLAALIQGMGNARKTQVWNDSFGRMLGYNLNPNYFQPGLEFRGGMRDIFSPGQQMGSPNMDAIIADAKTIGSQVGNDPALTRLLLNMKYPQLGGRSSLRSDGSGDYDASYSQPGMMQAIMQQLNSVTGGGFN